MTTSIFVKEYDGESLYYDFTGDMAEVFDPNYNEVMNDIPNNEYGFLSGRFKVSIEWSEENK